MFPKCKKVKALLFFNKRKRSTDGHMSYCKSSSGIFDELRYMKNPIKAKETAKTWANNNPEKRRQIIMKNKLRKYKMTIEDYDLMFFSQNGTCYICKKPETSRDSHSGKTKLLAVDHNHKTGQVRALAL